MTRTGHTEPCPPVILPVPVHSFINKSTLVPGQSPTFRSSLLWNCHDSKCPGLGFYISSEQRGQQKVYCPLIHCRDIDSAWVQREQCHLLNHKYHLLEQFFFYVSHLISIAQFSQLLGMLITFSFKELKFNFIQARYQHCWKERLLLRFGRALTKCYRAIWPSVIWPS